MRKRLHNAKWPTLTQLLTTTALVVFINQILVFFKPDLLMSEQLKRGFIIQIAQLLSNDNNRNLLDGSRHKYVRCGIAINLVFNV